LRGLRLESPARPRHDDGVRPVGAHHSLRRRCRAQGSAAHRIVHSKRRAVLSQTRMEMVLNQSQNWLRSPITLSYPRSPLAVRLCTISELAAVLRVLGLLAPFLFWLFRSHSDRAR